MSADTQTYVIDGGLAGKSRLNVLAQVMEPTTRALFERIGFEPGMSCLDAGSGGGDVAWLLAEAVGPHGQVVGIDFDPEIVRLTEADRRTAGLHHLSFEVADVLELEMEPVFDRVYVRFLLTHLADPARALRRLTRALRQGGVLVVEDVEMGGLFCHPPSPLFESGVHLYCAASRRKGGDPEIGPRLPGLLEAAGLHEVGVNLVQPVLRRGPGKELMSLTLQRIAAAATAEGLVSVGEVDELVKEIAAYEARPDTLIGAPRIFQVWGTR
jgi:SAM-dependent methyltransferase